MMLECRHFGQWLRPLPTCGFGIAASGRYGQQKQLAPGASAREATRTQGNYCGM
jgi:hypothetical protein